MKICSLNMYLRGARRNNRFKYSTLRYYTKQASILFEQQDENLTRRYPREASVKRIALKQLKKIGMTITEISDWIILNNEKE